MSLSLLVVVDYIPDIVTYWLVDSPTTGGEPTQSLQPAESSGLFSCAAEAKLKSYPVAGAQAGENPGLGGSTWMCISN